jgi:hypothetical protein
LNGSYLLKDMSILAYQQWPQLLRIKNMHFIQSVIDNFQS